MCEYEDSFSKVEKRMVALERQLLELRRERDDLIAEIEVDDFLENGPGVDDPTI